MGNLILTTLVYYDNYLTIYIITTHIITIPHTNNSTSNNIHYNTTTSYEE